MIKDLEEIKKAKPYLEGPLELYRKIKEFTKICNEKKSEVNLQERKGVLEFVLRRFSLVFDIPFDVLSFLIEKIIESRIDFVRDPRSLWELRLDSEEMGDEERKRMLFVLSKPFFIWLPDTQPDRSFKESGKCPICGSEASLGRITEDNIKILICPLCEYEGPFFRIGCPHCLTKDSGKIEILLDEEEIRVELCGNCKTYVKTFTEIHRINYGDPLLIDIISLPLDVVAQKKGYVRRSANALGVKDVI